MIKCYQTDYLNEIYFKPKVLGQKPVSEASVNITIDPAKTHQTIIGFGGAFTESAGYVYHNASEQVKQQIIKLYFDKELGIGYNLGRTVINSSDFALGNYCYIKENDMSLETFDLSHEELYTLPLLNDAMTVAPELTLMAAPWSPPAYMKTNNCMNFGGSLKKECYPLWAKYLIKYLDEMAKRGVKIEYLSIQNEPEANQTWDSCLYTPEEMASFVKVLATQLEQSNHKDLKIVVLDHNRDILVKWAKAFANDEEALKHTWGLGIHWYVSEDFSQLSFAKKICPNLHLIFTEGCIEGGVRPGAVATGERYARNIIGDFKNGCEGFIDWNLCLNGEGGPNHVKNYCDAPLLVKDGNLIINSSYYYIGHFSKFVKPGAVRCDAKGDDIIQHLAFKNPDGSVVMVLVNPTDDDIPLEAELENKKYHGVILKHTIETWCFEHE